MSTEPTTGALNSIGAIDAHSQLLRHRRVPDRLVSGRAVVARPSDGAALVFDATSTVVWVLLDDWIDRATLATELAQHFADSSGAELAAALDSVLELFEDGDLLERSSP